MADWVGGTVNPLNGNLVCDPVCGPSGAGACTFDVDASFPDSGLLYVNVHLDYGLKSMSGDFNPCNDSAVDRYDKDCLAPSAWGTTNALVNSATPYDCGGAVALDDCQLYAFSHDTDPPTCAPGDCEDSVASINAFKRNPGVAGFALSSVESGRNPIPGVPIELIAPTGAVVGRGTTDVDGFYMVTYKHKGKAATYTVRVKSPYVGAGTVILKGNGFEQADFTCTSASCVRD